MRVIHTNIFVQKEAMTATISSVPTTDAYTHKYFYICCAGGGRACKLFFFYVHTQLDVVYCKYVVSVNTQREEAVPASLTGGGHAGKFYVHTQLHVVYCKYVVSVNTQQGGGRAGRRLCRQV